MTEKEKEEPRQYWDTDAFLHEVIEHIEVETEDGKYVIFKRLTKGEESVIRKKTMKMIKNIKTNQLEPQIDSEEYQIKLLAVAIVKPKMTEQEIRDKVSSQRADELFFLYNAKIGFGSMPQNL